MNDQFEHRGQVFKHGDSVTFSLNKLGQKAILIRCAKIWMRQSNLWICQDVAGEGVDPRQAFGYTKGIHVKSLSKLNDPISRIQHLRHACTKPRDGENNDK